MRRVFFLLVLLVAVVPNAFAQFPLSTSGTSFSFGVIEGAENAPGGVQQNLPHGITLTILSPFNGSGNINSPCGFAASFNFSAMKPTVIALPDSLIHLRDNGKTKKGLLVTTSQPVSLVLHDALIDA